jgi:hypothetical protein
MLIQSALRSHGRTVSRGVEWVDVFKRFSKACWSSWARNMGDRGGGLWAAPTGEWGLGCIDEHIVETGSGG